MRLLIYSFLFICLSLGLNQSYAEAKEALPVIHSNFKEKSSNNISLDIGIMDNILERYKNAAKRWRTKLKEKAAFLFWSLALISLIWTLGTMALKKADVGEMFAEFARFCIFIGFFWWLLIHGATITHTIITSLTEVGSELTTEKINSPSKIVDLGFTIINIVIKNLSIWQISHSICLSITAFVFFFIIILLAANMLLLMCSAWILAYVGIFLLGFGGSKWTSNIAINYYKNVIAISIQLLVMILLIDIGYDFLKVAVKEIQNNNTDFTLMRMFSLTGSTFVLFFLCNKLPVFVSSIIMGGSIGQVGIGEFGSGVALGIGSSAMSFIRSNAGAAISGMKKSFSSKNTMSDSKEAAADAFTKMVENRIVERELATGMFPSSGKTSDQKIQSNNNDYLPPFMKS